MCIRDRVAPSPMEACTPIRLPFTPKPLATDCWFIFQGLSILLISFEVELSLNSSRIYVMAYQPPSSAQKERTRFAYDAPPFSCGHICQGASGRNEERGDTFLSGVSYLTRNVSSLVMSFVSSLRRSSSEKGGECR